MSKAEDRHEAARDAYHQAVETCGANDVPTLGAERVWRNAGVAHQAAIDGADACTADVTALHEARMKEHRNLVAASRAKLTELQKARAQVAPVM
jgi:hypothetical protein